MASKNLSHTHSRKESPPKFPTAFACSDQAGRRPRSSLGTLFPVPDLPGERSSGTPDLRCERQRRTAIFPARAGPVSGSSLPTLSTHRRADAGPVRDAVPVEAARVMRPDDGPGADAAPSVFATYRTLLEPGCRCSPWIASASMPPAANRTSLCASPPATTASTPTSCWRRLHPESLIVAWQLAFSFLPLHPSWRVRPQVLKFPAGPRCLRDHACSGRKAPGCSGAGFARRILAWWRLWGTRMHKILHGAKILHDKRRLLRVICRLYHYMAGRCSAEMADKRTSVR